MVTRASKNWHGCPIRYGAAVFGDVWSLLILRDIMFKGARHYADFLNAPEEISTNVLAARLAKLEDEGVLLKTRDPNNKTRVIYRLTTKGEALMPIMLEIIDWSQIWDEKTEVPAEFIADLRQDRVKFARQIVESIN